MAKSYKPNGRRHYRPRDNRAYVPTNGRLEALQRQKATVAERDALYLENMALLKANPPTDGGFGRVQQALMDRAWARYRRSLHGRTDFMAQHGGNFNSVGERM